jgi:hypothetical protein
MPGLSKGPKTGRILTLGLVKCNQSRRKIKFAKAAKIMGVLMRKSGFAVPTLSQPWGRKATEWIAEGLRAVRGKDIVRKVTHVKKFSFGAKDLWF